ncbi:hypothetical protein [Salinibaculum salinum]|uniref:hypothetical protein n=1 Tax=Salinibaculum salinum TaxID=3131996 RepID=UPI0030ED7585
MTDESGESETGTRSGIDDRLAGIRTDTRQRRLALGAAIVLGLGAVALHWVGLFAAGALVGLTRRSLPRALAAGLAFGMLVLAVFFVATPVISPGNVLVLAPLSYVTVGIALVGPVWGALVRGVV